MYFKRLVQAALRWCIKGANGGLSPLGHRLERLARYIIFVVRGVRLRAQFIAPLAAVIGPELTHPGDGIVYDIGANNGDDTEYYLKKGFRVVAVEADPCLVDSIRRRFSREVAEGRLAILNVAVTDSDAERVDFYINENNDKVGSLVIPTNRDREWYRKIEVPAQRLSDIIDDHGQPFYVKIDVEGLDANILSNLFRAGHRPQFVSAEAQKIGVLCEMVAAGYKQFKIVEGKFVHRAFHRTEIRTVDGSSFEHLFPKGSSAGPFGDDIPGAWINADAVFEYLSEYGLGWKDIHARWHGTATAGCRS